MAQRLDRLSTLVTRFAVGVTADPAGEANLVILDDPVSGDVTRVIFLPGGGSADDPESEAPPAFRARAQWGGTINPLVSALPERIDIPVQAGSGIEAIATLLASEARERRCGSGAVMDRLGEVLLVRMLRRQLDAGTARVGLLAGLADPRLCGAIVAMHDRPGTAWNVELLAGIAGLSASRFAERFARLVGTTPMSYLRQWRMVLARQDVERGDRIQLVAARYGYASSEALSRVFKRLHGHKPTAFRTPRGSSVAG